MKPNEQAEVVADVFQDAGWTTTPVEHVTPGAPRAFVFTAWVRSPGLAHGSFYDTVTVWVYDSTIKLSTNYHRPQQAAWRVLKDAGLGQHVRFSVTT